MTFIYVVCMYMYLPEAFFDLDAFGGLFSFSPEWNKNIRICRVFHYLHKIKTFVHLHVLTFLDFLFSLGIFCNDNNGLFSLGILCGEDSLFGGAISNSVYSL